VAIRRDYALASLDVADVDPDPLVQFRRWFDEAVAAQLPEPDAMTLATSTAGGKPSARVVLLKAVDAGGFVFYTDYRSPKAEDLDANPRAALVFLWKEIERQVRVEGAAARVDAATSDAYFRTRPLGARLGAWSSHQSTVIPTRAWLAREVERTAARFPDGQVPRPPHWGGYRVVPETLEFWQGRPDRLHDRLLYRSDGGRWRIERLSP
jgi:pyridoxamine 5'-phosphate oxidase